MTYPNGVYTTYEYDQNNYRLLSIKHYNKLGVMYDHYDYTYDNVGNRITMTTSMDTHLYEYDALYQLMNVYTLKRSAQEYRYDPAGNRTYYRDKDVEIGDYSYNNANEMIAANGVSYTYDGNGNLTSKGDFTYSWDFKNQLTEVKKSGATVATFVYDGDGRRMRSTYNAGPTTINYIWDGMSEILETDGSGNVVTEYLNGAGEILGKIRYLPSGIRQVWYYLHDGLGSTTYLLDNYGNIVNAYYYEPYGKCWNVTHDPGYNTRFTGKEYEEDLGLYYFFARWYDADVGRFVSRDPLHRIINLIGEDETDWMDNSIYLYNYANNNPINYTDPMGLEVIYKQANDVHLPNAEMQKLINSMDKKMGGDQKLIISSGTRSKTENNKIHGKSNSKHLTGDAVDISFRSGYTESQIKEVAKNLGLTIIRESDHYHLQRQTK